MRHCKFALVTAAAAFVSMAAFAGEATDMDGIKTANGKLAVEYLTMKFNDGKMQQADKLYASHMIEHGYLGMAQERPGGAPPPEVRGTPMKMSMDVKKVIVQGDLVFVQAHGMRGNTGNGDLMWILYRIKDGQIVEHWDTHNPIPDNQVGKQW